MVRHPQYHFAKTLCTQMPLAWPSSLTITFFLCIKIMMFLSQVSMSSSLCPLYQKSKAFFFITFFFYYLQSSARSKFWGFHQLLQLYHSETLLCSASPPTSSVQVLAVLLSHSLPLNFLFPIPQVSFLDFILIPFILTFTSRIPFSSSSHFCLSHVFSLHFLIFLFCNDWMVFWLCTFSFVWQGSFWPSSVLLQLFHGAFFFSLKTFCCLLYNLFLLPANSNSTAHAALEMHFCDVFNADLFPSHLQQLTQSLFQIHIHHFLSLASIVPRLKCVLCCLCPLSLSLWQSSFRRHRPMIG